MMNDQARVSTRANCKAVAICAAILVIIYLTIHTFDLGKEFDGNNPYVLL